MSFIMFLHLICIMVELLERLPEIFNAYPTFIIEGCMEILIMIVGGIIVGYITSKYLYRINELNKVEGWLLEKRIPIYEELYKRTVEMVDLYMVSPEEFSYVSEMINKHGIDLGENARQVSQLFLDGNKLSESFLEFDKYAAQNRLMFDEEVAKEVIVLTNYFGLIRRMLVLFDEQMIDKNITDNPKVQAVRSHLVVALGVCLSEEFIGYVMSLQNALRVSISHLQLSHREKPDYSYDFYQSENGYLMTRIRNSKAIVIRDKMKDLITDFVALGMIAGGLKGQED